MAELSKRDVPALVASLHVRALALTGAEWERNATRDMMNEAAEQLADLQAQVDVLTAKLAEERRERKLLGECFDASEARCQELRTSALALTTERDEAQRRYDELKREALGVLARAEATEQQLHEEVAGWEKAESELFTEQGLRQTVERQLQRAQGAAAILRAVLFRLTSAKGFIDGKQERLNKCTWYPRHQADRVCDPAVFCVPCIAQRALDDTAKEPK